MTNTERITRLESDLELSAWLHAELRWQLTSLAALVGKLVLSQALTGQPAQQQPQQAANPQQQQLISALAARLSQPV